jgi:transcriptional regulator with XRE-family HTH domain
MDNNELEQNLKTLISKKLRQLRENSSETLEKTADFLDLNYSQYYRLLQGTQLPHLATLMKINQAYGLNMDWWFEDFAEIRTTKVLTKETITQKAAERELLNNFNKLDARSRKALQKILKTMLKKRRDRWPVNNVYFFQCA